MYSMVNHTTLHNPLQYSKVGHSYIMALYSHMQLRHSEIVYGQRQLCEMDGHVKTKSKSHNLQLVTRELKGRTDLAFRLQ